MKKTLALLLTALLVFSLALPAMASIDTEAIKITVTGPEDVLSFGVAFTLRVSVDLPDGVEIASYQWSDRNGPLNGATDSVLKIAPDNAFYPTAHVPYAAAVQNYRCEITFVEKDADGNEIDSHVQPSKEMRVEVAPERKPRFFEILRMSFSAGLSAAAMGAVMSGFLLLPLTPIVFFVMFFVCFFHLLFG